MTNPRPASERAKYFDNFDSLEAVRMSFSPDAEEKFPTDEQMLFAAYGGGDYDGTATVLFEMGGKLYSVYGNHCSCYGLEGQWEPEETDWGSVSMSDYGMSAEKCMRWGGMAISEETSRKFKFWRRRMDSAAARLYWERNPEPRR